MTDDQFRDRLLDAVERIHERIEAVRAELRTELRDARAEQAEDHKQVKARLQSLEQGQTTIYQWVTAVETKDEAEHARAEGAHEAQADARRRLARLGGLVVGVAVVATAASGLVFQILDHVR